DLTVTGVQTCALPIYFTAGDAAVESRAERIEREVGTSGSGGVTWSRPILFFTDGSAVDAFVVVGNEHNSGIRIDLRGMTSALKEIGRASCRERGNRKE